MARKKEKENFNDSKKQEKETSKQESGLALKETEGNELKEESQEGLLVLIKTSEEIKMEQDHDANVRSIDFNGILNVKNPSSLDRIWNVEIKLKNIENTTLESNVISIKELGTNEDNNTYSQNFQLAKEVKKKLLVKEYINTSPNADDVLNFKDVETDLMRLKDKSFTVEQKEEGKIAILEKEEKFETEEKSEKTERIEPMVEGETEFKREEKVETMTPENIENQVKEWFEQMKSQRKEEADLDEEIKEKQNEQEEKPGNISENGGVNAANYSLESLGLSINQVNNVKFVLAILNSFEKPIINIKLVKNFPVEFGNLTIASASIGSAKIEENKLIWTVENLPVGNCEFLKFSADIHVKSLETIGSGPIEIDYTATSSLVEGIEIEKFEALTRNKFYVDMIEREETPSLWDCKLVFENPSEFKMELFSVNVHSPENEAINFVVIDKDNIPKLRAGGQWNSNIWHYENKDYPAFVKKLDFRVMPMFKTEVKGIIKIDEIRFVLGSIGGEVAYNIAEPTKVSLREKIEENVIVIPSYKEANINAVLKVVNNGSSSLNEVIVEHKCFSEIFQPPNREEVKLSWNGKEIDLAPKNVIIDENFPKKLTVVLKNLRESSWGMFEPNSVIEVLHPIHAINPPRDAKLEPEIIYRANTYPLGQEITYVPEPENIPKIQVIHVRRKYRVGKEITPIGEVGNYEIILLVENMGEFSLKEFVLMDKVPSNFEYGEFTTEPEITREAGTKFLKWNVKSIEEGKTLEFKYKIHGNGQYHPSEAQVAF